MLLPQVLPLYFLSDNCTAIATRPGADLTALRQVQTRSKAAGRVSHSFGSSLDRAVSDTA
jgi:hypothetical protein